MKMTVSIITLSMAVALQTSTAFAGKQIYPGSMCVPWSQGDVVPTLNHSRIFNTSSTKEMRVDCPILHQNFNSISGNDLDDGDIGIIDAHPSRDAKCYLASRYQIGSTVFGTGNTRVSTGFGNHEQNLDFDPTGRHPENWYYIGCIIPRTYNGQASGITYYSGQD